MTEDETLDKILHSLPAHIPHDDALEHIVNSITAHPQIKPYDFSTALGQWLSDLASPWPEHIARKSALLACIAFFMFGAGLIQSPAQDHAEDLAAFVLMFGDPDDLEVL